MILVIAEQQAGALSRASWEAVVAGQQAAGILGGLPVTVAIAGDGIGGAAAELAGADVAGVVTIEDPALALYAADAYLQVYAALVASLKPAFVFVAHTYQARDFLPALAARLDAPLVPDVVALRESGGRLTFGRPLFQGKLVVDLVADGDGPVFASVQAAAFRADLLRRGSSAAPVTPLAASIDVAAVRQRPEPPFREARQAVNLAEAERIVSVGRGIKNQDQLPLAERLAAALGAEIGASRPICDAGWLPMERQIGSSGQTVAPKLYVALGVSGAIQHLVGMKGSRTIVAINKDPDAPIFEVADYGIVGDLFEVVPAIIAALQR